MQFSVFVMMMIWYDSIGSSWTKSLNWIKYVWRLPCYIGMCLNWLFLHYNNDNQYMCSFFLASSIIVIINIKSIIVDRFEMKNKQIKNRLSHIYMWILPIFFSFVLLATTIIGVCFFFFFGCCWDEWMNEWIWMFVCKSS